MANIYELAAAGLRVLENVRPLDESGFIFDAMLQGWDDQQQSRGLARHTIDVRTSFIRRFSAFCEKLPWEWAPVDLEDFSIHALSRARP